MARLPEVLAGSKFNDIVKVRYFKVGHVTLTIRCFQLIHRTYNSILFAIQLPDNTISLNPGNDVRVLKEMLI